MRKKDNQIGQDESSDRFNKSIKHKVNLENTNNNTEDTEEDKIVELKKCAFCERKVANPCKDGRTANIYCGMIIDKDSYLFL